MTASGRPYAGKSLRYLSGDSEGCSFDVEGSLEAQGTLRSDILVATLGHWHEAFASVTRHVHAATQSAIHARLSRLEASRTLISV